MHVLHAHQRGLQNILMSHAARDVAPPRLEGMASLVDFLHKQPPPTPIIDVGAQYDRFQPSNSHDALVAVYTVWNVLDRFVAKALHNRSVPWAYGYISPVQLEALIRAVRSVGVRTYCEVGFNGGHSAAAVLFSAPNVTVRSFDSGAYGAHTLQNSDFLRMLHPQRFEFVQGDSRTTLPLLAQRIRAGSEPSCDVIFIDGGHSRENVERDMENMAGAATCGAYVFLDDLELEPGDGLKAVVARGLFAGD